MSHQLPFETEEYTFTIHHLDTKETFTFDDESDVKEILEQISWEKHEWTPLLQENIHDDEFILYVHSETYDEEIYSEEGIKSWEARGYDLDDDGDFWERFQKEFNIRVVTTPKGSDSK